MRTKKELQTILQNHSFNTVDAHIHTYLCDGAKEMTVKNIADQAVKKGMTCVILTPHFHKKVQDKTAVLYEDTDESMLIRLREEIEDYEKAGGGLKILLSTEADILSTTGETALKISKAGEDALDLVTPTVNYHPLLPLKAVEVTYGRCIADIHGSGLYQSFVEKAGGLEYVLEKLYETEANAILKSPYPCMLGHFFAAHAYPVGTYNWFGAEPCHLELMKQGAEKVVDACVKTGAMIDLTGIHWGKRSAAEQREQDGFFYDFQKWFMTICEEKGIGIFPGTDSHGLGTVGDISYYKTLKG